MKLFITILMALGFHSNAQAIECIGSTTSNGPYDSGTHTLIFRGGQETMKLTKLFLPIASKRTRVDMEIELSVHTYIHHDNGDIEIQAGDPTLEGAYADLYFEKRRGKRYMSGDVADGSRRRILRTVECFQR